MNRKSILCSISLIVIFSMLVGSTTSAAQTTAQPGKEPGEPGLSYRYESTIGVNREPYLTDGYLLNRPGGTYIDALDNLFVAESFGQRALGYDASGTNIFTVGHPGVPDYPEGYLNFPWEVTVDANGNIWLVENYAVYTFDAAGTRKLVFPQDDPWNAGNDNAHFNEPSGISFDDNGFLMVSDFYNHRVQVYSVSGFTLTYVNTIGETSVPGSDDLHFNGPVRLAFDSSNALYVMDSANFRVQKCVSADNWDTWSCSKFFGGAQGSDPGNGELGYAWGIAIDAEDNVFIADSMNFRVLKCTPAGDCAHFVGTVGEQGNDNSHFDSVADVSVDSTGKVYVSDRDNMRIQVYTSDATYDKTMGETEVAYLVDAEHYNQPWGVANANNGSLYIVENSGCRLIKLKPDGTQAWTVGKAGVCGSGNDQLGFASFWGDSGKPVEAADGEVLMPDAPNNRIQIFDAETGVYSSTFGEYGQGENQFYDPTSIAINPTNQDILVADSSNQRVQVYTSEWIYKTTIGETGVGGNDEEHFNRPRGVAVDAEGAVFVADSDNYRIQKCTTTDGVAYTCTTLVAGTGDWSTPSFDQLHPTDVELDVDGRLYVTSDWFNAVQIYDANGAFLTILGGSCDSRSGSLCYPEVSAVDSQGNLYVGDMMNHRIQKYTPGVPGWMQVNINGFGSRAVDQLPAMEGFDGYLYVGSSNYADGIHHIFRTFGDQLWEEISFDFDAGISSLMGFDGQLYAGTWGGSIWKSPDGLSYTQTMTVPEGMGIASFSQFDNAIYAGSWCNNTGEGSVILKSINGEDWSSFVTNGLGDPNACGVISSAEFDGNLYWGVGDWSGTAGGRIWRTDGITVTVVVSDGFGSPDNYAPGGMAVFGDYLYASIYNPNSDQVWRSNSGEPGSWSKVLEIGLDEAGAKDRTGLIVLDNHLFLTTQNDTSGMHVWRTGDGETWQQVGFDGFGDSNNVWSEWSSSLAIFNGQLHIGVNNFAQGGEVWRYEPEITADFSASPTVGAVPLEVTFTNASTGDITSSLWDFGDGFTSTLTSPVHTYTAPGVYTVTLVAGSFGHTDTLTKVDLITVEQKFFLPVIRR